MVGVDHNIASKVNSSSKECEGDEGGRGVLM